MPNPDGLLEFTGIDPDISVRSEKEREIAIRFMKWGEIGETEEGLEAFDPGAFDEAKADEIVVRMEHEGPPAGRGIGISKDEKGAILIARPAPTARGDELWTLARDGYYKGASPMYKKREDGTRYARTESGRRVAVRTKVDLREVSLTWRPTYKGTEVLYARSEMEDQPVAEEYVPAAGEDVPKAATSFSADDRTIEQMRAFAGKASEEVLSPLAQRIANLEAREQMSGATFQERLAALEARSETATSAQLPDVEDDRPQPKRGDWMKAALTIMDGGDLPAYERRALADNISDDNAGFIPVAYSNELIGIIDPSRPFLNSTRRIDMPANGLQISYPRITQRPTVAEQTTEKTEVSSTAVHSDRVTADVRTFAGAGDISLQLLRRSSPEFLNAYLELLAEAYASTTENAAVDAILAAGVTAGTGTFDPEEANFAEAFENGAAAGRTLIPDTMWMSTTAVAEFIAARAITDQAPAYPGLAGITGLGGGGVSPSAMRLNPVWVPALDDETVDILIGPSRGFAWGEEGTFTLTADVPGRLGRDVALGGFMVFVPLYPAAFTRYVVAT